MSSLAERARSPFIGRSAPAIALARPSGDLLWTVGLAAVMAAIGFYAGGGVALGPLTAVEIVLDLAAAVLVSLAVIAMLPRRGYGIPAALLVGLLAGLTALSVIWSVNPNDSWLEANRTLAYAATFAGGVALSRLAGRRWASMVGATTLAAVVVCGYALLTKVFPGALNPGETYARLREPFGYWNAVGLMAALGVPGCLWLGARRDGRPAVNALAFPALGLLILTMLLAYSRGALLAAGLGAVFWFACVPLRLRGFAVLAVAAAGAGLVAAWAFAQPGLTEDKIDVSLRATGGHELAVALVAMLAALLVAGFAVGFAAARWPLPAPRRRRAGILILSGLALVPLIVVAALALSNRGLSGSVSHGWNQLTNPHARTPPNEPGRLTAVGSVRARYWNEALKIFKARPVLGSGAGGYATARPQFRQDTLDVRHAHGYVVQTLADLGLVGLAVSVAALAAWLVAAIRATGLHGAARREPYGSERIGLLTLFAVVIVFGVHSFVDWTWFIPGTIVPALLCAGWIAGRGPVLAGSAGSPTWSQRAELRASDPRLAAAVAIGVVAFAAAWATYQPLRAVHAGDGALADLEAGHVARARQAALHAHSINPVSIDPLFDLAAIESESGHPAAARAALEQAVALQPSNAEPWLRLAEFDYDAGSVQAALADLGPALHLDPRSPVGEQLFLEINRKVGGTATP